MPQCSTWIDDLREAFGPELINDQIRRGMRGEAVFYASEGGQAIGTHDGRPVVEVHYGADGMARQEVVR